MKKSIRLISLIITIITIITLVFIMGQRAYATEELTIQDFSYIQKCNDLIEDLTLQQEHTRSLAQYMRYLGCAEDHRIIILTKENWEHAEELKQEIEEKLCFWEDCFEEYPYATYIWLYCKSELEYTDDITAGIMGNIMAEVGGGTLQLKPFANSTGYYGFCQWSKKYCPEVNGASLQEQCVFLKDTIQTELDNFGFVYKNKYKYKDFILLTSYKDAALMFAKSYERCASGTYTKRQEYAAIAYEYFNKET